MVIGPPAAICSRNFGTTLPLLPRTLPKRTMTKLVPNSSWSPWMTISARRLLAPMTLVGLTALSVETSTNLGTPAAWQALASV